MQAENQNLSWPEVAMFGAAGVAGAGLGILTAIWMSNAIAAQSSFFWFVSRAAAVVAYGLLWLSVAWGITLSSKGLGGRVSGPMAFALHNVTSWLALGFSAVHAVALLGDFSVPFTMTGVMVPFLANYKPVLSGLGTLSFYIGLVVTGAFYFKKRLGYKAWRTIHGLSYAMFFVVTAHSILLGTDTSTLIMRAIYLVAGVSVVLLTAFRLLTVRSNKRPGARPQPARQPAAQRSSPA
jgi:predicted ferric reductase